MNMERKQDLKITGTGQANGGVFGKVKITGQGQIDGTLTCESMVIAGDGRVNGLVQAGKISINGSSVVTGDVHTGSVSVNGHLDIDRGLSAKEISLNGMIRVGGHLVGEEIRLRGGLDVEGDCEIENFSAKGAITIGGLLNVGKMDLRMHWPSRATEIGGERIEVKRVWFHGNILGAIVRMFHTSGEARLVADCIEGDHIDLEYTEAMVVRGNHIIIGPGCEIDLVEYRSSLHVADDAIVRSHRRV